MDPITLIVMALAAGASSGAIDALKDDANEGARAAHGKLHDLVRQRFQGNTSAEGIVAEHQADPDTYERQLAKKLTEAGTGGDADLVTAAAEVMLLADPAQARAGKFNVTIYGGQNIIVGDYGVQVILRDRDHREDAASFRNVSSHQIVDAVRQMSPEAGELMLAEAGADDARIVLDPLLQLDPALAVSLLAGIKRDKAEELIAAAVEGAPGMDWLRQLPKGAEAIDERGRELRWTTAGRLEHTGDYSSASQAGTRARLHRRTPPPPPAPVYRRAYEGGIENRYVYWCEESGKGGARALKGVIFDHYEASGGPRGPFGIPVGEEISITFAGGDRSVQRFSSGAIYRHGSSVLEVERGVADYLDRAHDGGVHLFYPLGPKAALQRSWYDPKSLDAPPEPHRWMQRFLGPGSAADEQTVYYLDRATAHGVSGEIANYYELRRGAEGAEGWLGYPTSDATYQGTRVTQDFQGGTVFVGLLGSKAVSVSLTSMALIKSKGMLDLLGFPVATEEQFGHDGTTLQFFESGVVTFKNKKGEIWIRPDQV